MWEMIQVIYLKCISQVRISALWIIKHKHDSASVPGNFFTYIYTVFFHILSHDGLSQDIEYILRHAIRHCSLSILCILVYICWSQTPSSPLPYPPTPLATTILFSMSVSLLCDRQFLFYFIEV